MQEIVGSLYRIIRFIRFNCLVERIRLSSYNYPDMSGLQYRNRRKKHLQNRIYQQIFSLNHLYLPSKIIGISKMWMDDTFRLWKPAPGGSGILPADICGRCPRLRGGFQSCQGRRIDIYRIIENYVEISPKVCYTDRTVSIIGGLCRRILQNGEKIWILMGDLSTKK